jgi:hypothetical protein
MVRRVSTRGTALRCSRIVDHIAMAMTRYEQHFSGAGIANTVLRIRVPSAA